jgi:hypothetical protein
MAVPPKQILPSSGAATTQQTQQPKRKGTGFTNLQRVMQASQGSKLGQTIAGGITGQAQQVQSGVKSAQEEFEKKAEQERLDSAKNKELVASGIQQASQSGDISSDTSSLFDRVRAGEYKGPTGLTDTQRLYSQAQQAQQLGALASGIGGDAATRSGGRQELLRRFAGGSDYTAGQRKLDESILARDKQANLAAAARQTRGAAQDVERAGQVAQAKGQEYSNLAKLFAKQTGEQLGAAQEDIIQREIDPELQKAVAREQERKVFFDRLQGLSKQSDILTSGQVQTPEQRQAELIDLLKEGGKQGFVSQADLDVLTPTTQIYDPSTGFISRAASFKEASIDPLSYIANLAKNQGINAQNLTTEGMAAKLGKISRLGALEKLAGRTGLDAKYGEATQAFKEGVSGLEDITPFKLDVLRKEKTKLDNEIQSNKEQTNASIESLKKQFGTVGGKDFFQQYRFAVIPQKDPSSLPQGTEGTIDLKKLKGEGWYGDKAFMNKINAYNNAIIERNRLNPYLKLYPYLSDLEKEQTIKQAQQTKSEE